MKNYIVILEVFLKYFAPKSSTFPLEFYLHLYVCVCGCTHASWDYAHTLQGCRAWRETLIIQPSLGAF